ncbi:MAG TPA: hypothetical protein VGQ36_20155 [Thermoanaerobaculia bacterium]|jgi:hypothetical protein|nr:hypothetical protein [Thermoanaerobaculia bacterium]
MVKAALHTLVVIAVLVAGVFPPCSGDACCAISAEPSVHREMPCCAESSMVSRDPDPARVVPATSAGSVPPVAVVESPDTSDSIQPRVHTTLVLASSTHHQPDPPLFLLNAQFLI